MPLVISTRVASQCATCTFSHADAIHRILSTCTALHQKSDLLRKQYSTLFAVVHGAVLQFQLSCCPHPTYTMARRTAEVTRFTQNIRVAGYVQRHISLTILTLT